jgi:PAS domain S-box-containing protein
MGKSEHFVQFYDEDSFLLKSVSGFVGAGFRQGEAAIVIATGPHRESLEQLLRADGFDPAALKAEGTFYPLDAAETLAKFMLDGMPDRRLFMQVVGGLVARVTAKGRPLRAFGEMVALLWAEGNGEAAIRLEEFWNELGQEHCFSLFCAYPLGEFRDEANGQPFVHICKAHTRVIPAESYSGQASIDDRLRAITLLQQKAGSLEAEVARRKEIETALIRRERELSDFLENATEGIHQVDASGKVLWANKAELDLLGYQPAEYIGHDIRKFHADEDVIADILQRLSRGEKLHDYEARLKHKDGSHRYVSINSSVYWDGDRFGYSRCFTRDITERKLASEILERTVVHRTAQLCETVAQLEAFSYSISHDMRSPLRAMHGYAKALLDDYGTKLDPAAVDSLQRIQRASLRLDLLIRDVLAFSKVAKGELDLKPIPLRPLLDDVIREHPELERAKNCISIVEPLHTVRAHEAYLTQCLTNLLENGVKFVAPGSIPQVQVRSEAVNGHIRVSIADNGIGIHPDHHERIFKIFGRIHPEKRYPGTGIGLAIVKKAVARMNGETGFESEPGKGSRFWFTLPNGNGNGH